MRSGAAPNRGSKVMTCCDIAEVVAANRMMVMMVFILVPDHHESRSSPIAVRHDGTNSATRHVFGDVGNQGAIGHAEIRVAANVS